MAKNKNIFASSSFDDIFNSSTNIIYQNGSNFLKLQLIDLLWWMYGEIRFGGYLFVSLVIAVVVYGDDFQLFLSDTFILLTPLTYRLLCLWKAVSEIRNEGRKEMKIPFHPNFIFGFNDYSVAWKVFMN